MANRLIRGEMLDSQAVLSLPADGRWLYVAILLIADDVGLFEATAFRLARRADVRVEVVGKLLSMLADNDLIRMYEDAGKQYGFIPKYGQRLQIKRAKHPLPPFSLLHGDEDALNKIKHLTSNPTVDHGDSRMANGGSPSEPEPEPERDTDISVIPTVLPRQRPKAADTVPPCPHRELIELFAKHLPELPQPKVELWAGTKERDMRARWRWALTTSRDNGKRYAENHAEGLAFFHRFFAYAAKSDFLTGRDGRWGGCSLAWLMNATNFAKVMEGNYDNKEKS